MNSFAARLLFCSWAVWASDRRPGSRERFSNLSLDPLLFFSACSPEFDPEFLTFLVALSSAFYFAVAFSHNLKFLFLVKISPV